MLAGMLVSFIIANAIAGSVSTPVKELAGFAEDISKGNFEQREFAFQDKEFKELEIPVYSNDDTLSKNDINDKIIHFPFKINDNIVNELPKLSGFMAKGGFCFAFAR